MPVECAQVIKKIFEFKPKEIKDIHQLPLTEIQNYVLQGQATLSDLFDQIPYFTVYLIIFQI
jgi:hypothetical protein